MKTFIKANVASIIASLCDFLCTVILKEFFSVNAIAASILGTVTGGVINFFIGRYWAFKVDNKSISSQGKRYFVTWVGNLILNALGVYLLINYTGLNYKIAKIVILLTVAVAYNYPLQKKYVFKNN